MSIFSLLLFVLPLELDTFGVSISLGIKSQRNESPKSGERSSRLPPWLHTAMLFSLAETLMPLAGLVIGYAASLLISNVMHFVGPLLCKPPLIGSPRLPVPRLLQVPACGAGLQARYGSPPL